MSSSTNMSRWGEDIAPVLDPLAGTAHVHVPRIGNHGMLTLDYPIDVPPGRAGIHPMLKLSYSSRDGDGVAGVGWSLSTGLGTIARTAQNGQLCYDRRDTFTYNGRRLVKVSGPAGAEEGVYRMEIESGFSRFELRGTATGGVWYVRDSTGTVTVFGRERSHRIYHPGYPDKTYAWNFSRSTDLNGNFMAAGYDDADYENSRMSYLSEIRYTGNEHADTPARQYVRFRYMPRVEAYVSKAPGFVVRMDRLLESIEVGYDSHELWRYEMVYRTSPDSGRPLLLTVKSTRTSTQPEFIYQEANHSFAWRTVSNPDCNGPETDHESTQYFEGDFNGDGISDMVFFNPETGDWKAAEGRRDGGFAHRLYANRFQGFRGPSKIQWFKGNVTGDYNGDGRSDIAFYLPETREMWVAEHNGEVFEFRMYGRQYLVDLDISRCEWFPGDFDGNGISDAVLFDEGSGGWIFMRNMGGFFEFERFSTHFQNLFRGDYDPDGNLDSPVTSDYSDEGEARGAVSFLTGDYNGDGRTDISLYDGRTGAWYVGENYRNEFSGFRLEWRLYKVFTAPEEALFGNDRFSGDFNGDGLSDFLVFDRGEGEWVLGETGDGTIRFRVFSRLPAGLNITRWLQGDFNGDGRTDVGFYSGTDGNLWVGESAADGFHYRVYAHMSYGPDTERVLAAPLPGDKVKLESACTSIVDDSGTTLLEYQFDGNDFPDSGERVFHGRFSSDTLTSPELLIYKRSENAFYLKRGDGAVTGSPVLAGVDLEGDGMSLVEGGRARRYRSRDGLLYYRKKASLFGADRHEFHLVGHTGSCFADTVIAAYQYGSGDDEIEDFDLRRSIYFLDFFRDGNAENRYLLVLDDRADTPRFMRFLSAGAPGPISITAGSLSASYFRDIRERKSAVRVFSGRYLAAEGPAQLLLVDMSDRLHRWHLGRFEGGSIRFTELGGNPYFDFSGYTGEYRVYDNGNTAALVYGCSRANTIYFRRLIVGDTSIGQVTYSPLEEGFTFNNEFDHEGNPIVRRSDKAVRVRMGPTHYTLEEMSPNGMTVSAVSMSRPDLLERVYPFRWIQGDYNGDGKTDLGFFHLKERNWYFALTQGTVPDLMCRVRNGIGGTYGVEYINSSSLDNTGGDGIPDLPVNYKVVNRLTVDDGRGNRIVSRYEYKNGHAFSAFIEGRKETDYFGFGEFAVIDAMGGKRIFYHHNIPYDDFRMNRALAGAVKESRMYGTDTLEYGRTTYEYAVHEIAPSGPLQGPRSFLLETSKVQTYRTGVLVETLERKSEISPEGYALKSLTEKITDHYQDGVHSPVTAEHFSEYENVGATNEIRLVQQKSYRGSTHERTASYTYDGRGNLAEERLSYTGSGLAPTGDRVLRYEHDDCGNRVCEIDESGTPSRTVEKLYDNEFRQFVVEERRLKEHGRLSTRYAINYGSAFGAPSTRTNPAGNSVYYDYDPLGRVERVRADTDTGVKTIGEYCYDSIYPLSVHVLKHTGTLDSVLRNRVYADGLGRVIHTVKSATDAPGRRYTRSGLAVYDDLGRVIRRSRDDWASDENIESFIPQTMEKHPTVTEYNAIGRVRKITLPRSNPAEAETSTTFAYNGPWETVETHSAGRSKKITRNTRGLVLYVEDCGTGDDGAEARSKTGFTYDISGNRTKKMDLNGATMDAHPLSFPRGERGKDSSGNNIICWWYDGFGRVIALSDPDLGYTSIAYDDFGDAVSRTDARNLTTVMRYDRLGRLAEKRLPGAEGAVRYTYDELAGSENAAGRIVCVDDPSQRKEFSYDRLGRIKGERRSVKTSPLGGDEFFETRFAHDLQGRVTQLAYPKDPLSGKYLVSHYRHIPAGVCGIRAEIGTEHKELVSGIEYNEFGQVTKISRGNGVETAYEYDARGRMVKMASTVSSNNQKRKLQDVRYALRSDNCIASMENTPDIDTDGGYVSDIRADYRYDGLSRLVRASGTYRRSALPNGDQDGNTVKQYELRYGYAPNGNMEFKEVLDPWSHAPEDRWSYRHSNHAATRIDSTRDGAGRFEMRYDPAGNMVYQEDRARRLTRELFYDSNNRVRKMTDPGTGKTVGEYWYDDGGFRVRKKAQYSADGEIKHVEVRYPSMYFGVERQCTPDGRPLKNTEYSVNNVYLNGVRIAAIVPTGEARYYLTDQVDSVTLIADDNGKPLSRIEYLPYGETWFQEGEGRHNPKYNSQELDRETSLYFFNARYYDPVIAQFVTADTAVGGEYDTQGWNRFAYVKGNPVLYRDPTGHTPVGEGLAWAVLANRFFTSDAGSARNRDRRDYDRAISNKLQSARESESSRTGTSGKDIQKEMLGNYRTFTWRDEKGTWQSFHRTTIDGVSVDLCADVTREDIAKTQTKTLEVLKDMILRNRLTGMTISSLYRAGENQAPHNSGRGVDITELRRGSEIALMQDKDPNPANSRSESMLAKEVTLWLREDQKGRVAEVLTPWSINGEPNIWRNPNSPTLHKDHRNHLHIGIRP